MTSGRRCTTLPAPCPTWPRSVTCSCWPSWAFVFAFVYLLERDEIKSFGKNIRPRCLAGRLMRWFGFVVDAIAVTLQPQVVVAVFNAHSEFAGLGDVLPLSCPTMLRRRRGGGVLRRRG